MDEVVSRIDITCQVCEYEKTFTQPLSAKDWFNVAQHAYPSSHPVTIREVVTRVRTYTGKEAMASITDS